MKYPVVFLNGVREHRGCCGIVNDCVRTNIRDGRFETWNLYCQQFVNLGEGLCLR